MFPVPAVDSTSQVVGGGLSCLDIRWGFSEEETLARPWRAVIANWELFRTRLDDTKKASTEREPLQRAEHSPGLWTGRLKVMKSHLGGRWKLAATQESQYDVPPWWWWR